MWLPVPRSTVAAPWTMPMSTPLIDSGLGRLWSLCPDLDVEPVRPVMVLGAPRGSLGRIDELEGAHVQSINVTVHLHGAYAGEHHHVVALVHGLLKDRQGSLLPLSLEQGITVAPPVPLGAPLVGRQVGSGVNVDVFDVILFSDPAWPNTSTGTCLPVFYRWIS